MNTKAVFSVALGLCVVATIGSFATVKKKNINQTEPVAAVEPTENVTMPSVRSFTLTAVGDCTFARDESFDIETSFDTYAQNYGTDYFLANVGDIFAEDDLTLVNFEGTMSLRGQREDKTFAFRGSPDYVNILTGSSVEAANLANNHSMDYGTVSLEDTKQYLDEAGIYNCRGLDNIEVCDVNGIKVGLVGINYLNDRMRTELEPAIREAKSLGAEIVVLSIHWGIEKNYAATADQIDAAHRAIDAGADVVIGTHPHVLEGVEKYKGRYIYYSLGNFCFGGNSNPSDKDSVILRQTFTLDGDILRDDDAAELIPCRISGADSYNDYRPTPAQGAQKQNIINRMNEYTAALGDVQLKYR